jgi:transposase
VKKENKYKRLIQRVKSGVRAARIPRCFSKKKNNVFSNEQHIVIQVLMQLEGKALRDMPEFLSLLQTELHLARAIHFTTINKFALRIKQTYLEEIISKMVKSNVSSMVAIDGTGFSLNTRSPYFCTIAGERNRFMRTNCAAELNRKVITAVRLRRRKRNENIDVKYLIERTSEQINVSAFLADKAYDSEKNHMLAHEHGAKFVCPLKRSPWGKISFYRIGGRFRKQSYHNFPRELYRRRVNIESIFSAIKRRFGHELYCKKFTSQKNELLFRILAYNTEKLIAHCLTFYTALSGKRLLRSKWYEVEREIKKRYELRWRT